MRWFHCICAVLLISGPVPATGQTPVQAESRTFTVFLDGSSIGSERIAVADTDSGLLIRSQSTLDAPVSLELRNAEVSYLPSGEPLMLSIDSMVAGVPSTLEIRFEGGVAVSEGLDGATLINRSDPVSLRTIVLATGFFGAYEGFSRRLVDAQVGDEFRVYVATQSELSARVDAIESLQVDTPSSRFEIRRYDLMFENPDGQVLVSITAEVDGALARVTSPSQGLDVVRDDLVSPLTRILAYNNPGDESATIPADRFSLSATVTLPQVAGRHPAVILVSGDNDRDGATMGVPILARLAGSLADSGFIAVRYDRRGSGQSGGRIESVTIEEYARDVRAVFDWLEDRDDVDDDRISLVSHGEGAWVAWFAAARERDIAAVVSLGAPGVSGDEFVMESLQRALEQSDLDDAQRTVAVERQRRVNEAVLSGEGWDELPEEIRREADNPWFESYLSFDPVDVLEDVRTPLFIMNGDSDTGVPASHAVRLADIARGMNRIPLVDLTIFDGLNNQLTTGASPDKVQSTSEQVNAAALRLISEWLSTATEAR